MKVAFSITGVSSGNVCDSEPSVQGEDVVAEDSLICGKTDSALYHFIMNYLYVPGAL